LNKYIPNAVISHPIVDTGKVLSIRKRRPKLSIYTEDISVPTAFTKAKGMFRSKADSSYPIPSIETPAYMRMLGP